MHALLETVRSFAETHGLLTEEHVLVGISGGADSLVLADILYRLGHTLSAVHINFRLRGADSDADEALVRRSCDEREIPLVVRSFDTESVAEHLGKSIQEAARDLRYEVFAEIAASSGWRTVAVGHHRDDQAETVLLNLFRGTGPEGLAGMPVQREIAPTVRVVRPLLCLSRTEIEAYATGHGIVWRVDASNMKPVYRRGALRSEIIPLIEKHFGRAVTENIVRSSELVRAYVDLSMNEEVFQAFEDALAAPASDGDGALHVAVLADLPEVIRGRVLLEAMRRWLPGLETSYARVKEVEGLLGAQVGKRFEYEHGAVWRDRGSLRFISRRREGGSGEQILEAGRSCEVPQGLISAAIVEYPPDSLDAGSNVAYVDAGRLEFPLTVRPWRAGDRFRPLGMEQPKKISDFLTDARVPPDEKQRVHVVESNGRIVWVAGYRISGDFKVQAETNRILRISLEPRENTSPALE